MFSVAIGTPELAIIAIPALLAIFLFLMVRNGGNKNAHCAPELEMRFFDTPVIGQHIRMYQNGHIVESDTIAWVQQNPNDMSQYRVRFQNGTTCVGRIEPEPDPAQVASSIPGSSADPNQFDVTFLDVPLIGHICGISHNGQIGTTGKITGIQQDPANPAILKVTTSTGAVCVGSIGATPTTQVFPVQASPFAASPRPAGDKVALGIVAFFASLIVAAIFSVIAPLGVILLVLGTSIWVLCDASQECGRKGLGPSVSISWFFGCLLLWIVCFPWYIARRGDLREDKVSIVPFIILAVVIIGALLLIPWLSQP